MTSLGISSGHWLNTYDTWLPYTKYLFWVGCVSLGISSLLLITSFFLREQEITKIDFPIFKKSKDKTVHNYLDNHGSKENDVD